MYSTISVIKLLIPINPITNVIYNYVAKTSKIDFQAAVIKFLCHIERVCT